MDLQQLHEKIRKCKRCDLWRSRNNAVPGEGSNKGKVMFVGQSPGRNEDLQGRPFVGMAGKFLDKLLRSACIERERVFITSVVKCFPPKNRVPKREEIEACKPYLLTQIKLIRPMLIVLLGEVAVESLIGGKKVGEVRGRLVEKNGIVYFPTFHPAAAMRFPRIRKKTEEDFRKLGRFIAEKLK